MRKSLLAAAVTGVILLSAGVQAQEQAAPEGVPASAGADHEPP